MQWSLSRHTSTPLLYGNLSSLSARTDHVNSRMKRHHSTYIYQTNIQFNSRDSLPRHLGYSIYTVIKFKVDGCTTFALLLTRLFLFYLWSLRISFMYPPACSTMCTCRTFQRVSLTDISSIVDPCTCYIFRFQLATRVSSHSTAKNAPNILYVRIISRLQTGLLLQSLEYCDHLCHTSSVSNLD